MSLSGSVVSGSSPGETGETARRGLVGGLKYEMMTAEIDIEGLDGVYNADEK